SKNKNFGKTSPKFSESKFHSAKSQNAILITFFLYRSFLTIQYENVFQRLAVLIANSKLLICVGKRRGFFGKL
ncbi:MAG: hypothetical protein ACLSUH_14640, partial [Ruminococcus sp.]